MVYESEIIKAVYVLRVMEEVYKLECHGSSMQMGDNWIFALKSYLKKSMKFRHFKNYFAVGVCVNYVIACFDEFPAIK